MDDHAWDEASCAPVEPAGDDAEYRRAQQLYLCAVEKGEDKGGYHDGWPGPAAHSEQTAHQHGTGGTGDFVTVTDYPDPAVSLILQT